MRSSEALIASSFRLIAPASEAKVVRNPDYGHYDLKTSEKIFELIRGQKIKAEFPEMYDVQRREPGKAQVAFFVGVPGEAEDRRGDPAETSPLRDKLYDRAGFR